MGSKFIFDIEFQYEILKFMVNDRRGYKIINLIQDSYFTSINHAVITKCITKYFKKNKKIPSRAIFLEELRELFNHRDYAKSLTPTDRKEIITESKAMFGVEVPDGEQIIKKVEQFAQFNELSDVLENSDITDPNLYQEFVMRVQKAVSPKVDINNKRGTFLIKDIEQRQLDRQSNSDIVQTPFRQLNWATNANGYERGSTVVILDKPKKFKTGFMVQVVKGYMKQKKKILLFDLENGEHSLATRIEQSLSKKTKADIMSGDSDKDVRKVLRKYKRLGSEVYIKRLPAFCTTRDMQQEINMIKEEFGITFDILIVDYIGLMNSTTNRQDDHNRIADAYLDIANLAKENNYDITYSPHHIKDEARAREATRYRENDLAKCNEIGRHVHAIWGLNRSEEEEEAGVLRLELVVQRDGKPKARALFKVDADIQSTTEFTKEEIERYHEHFGDPTEAPEEEKKYNRKKKINKPNDYKEDL